jgi:hypothetical protein
MGETNFSLERADSETAYARIKRSREAIGQREGEMEGRVESVRGGECRMGGRDV